MKIYLNGLISLQIIILLYTKIIYKNIILYLITIIVILKCCIYSYLNFLIDIRLVKYFFERWPS